MNVEEVLHVIDQSLDNALGLGNSRLYFPRFKHDTLVSRGAVGKRWRFRPLLPSGIVGIAGCPLD
jgi:hypothetical protein